MDQIHNHYSGPITVQGANYQSHYVPAEKPFCSISIKTAVICSSIVGLSDSIYFLKQIAYKDKTLF